MTRTKVDKKQSIWGKKEAKKKWEGSKYILVT